MALKEFGLSALPDFADGTLDIAFQQHVKRAIADAEDRPGDKKPRKVSIEFEIKPVVLQDGACANVEIDAKIKSAIPPHISRPVECKIKHGGRAVFNDMSPGNVDQRTLDEV